MRHKGWMLLAAFAFGAAGPVQACVNAIGTDHQGRQFDVHDDVGEQLEARLTSNEVRKHYLRNARSLIAEAQSVPDLENLTKLAILLMYQGQHSRAAQLLLSIERRWPGHHETAANLGTALELSGHDAPALAWIRLGIQRNPAEHFGTEWLHARILESKLASAKDPVRLARYSIAGLQFGDATVPPLPATLPAGNDGRRVDAYALNQAFAYQLGERMQFVLPKDPVVANLLSDWAALNMAGGPMENVVVLYALAERYGSEETATVARRQAEARRILKSVRNAEHPGGRCVICEPGPTTKAP
ncbi:hypothetical protein LJR168_000132 [Pseudoxanthomonas sp. LjRoot168]|uniref:hypothetical protein n=1 Tax=unclassified Pseudoxanthomonas TaxID=2645906 RepID=UPI003ECD3B3D